MNVQPRRLGDLAEFVQGRVIGDPEILIHGVASVETARKSEITFALNEKYLQAAEDCQAACIIVPPEIVDSDKTLLQAANPRFAFAKIATLFAPARRVLPGVAPSAVVAATARLGREVAIGALAVVEDRAEIGDGAVLYPGVYVGPDSRIGAGTVLHPQVTVAEGVAVGAHCIIHAGTVLGADGFGFVEHEGKHYKIPQVGTVVIEDNVEIGANCTIDRAASEETIIRSGTKIDNLVHVAHNVQIGHDCLIVAQVGISGSVTIGDRVTLAGQVGVAGHLAIGDRTVVAAKSGVTKTLPGGMHASGFPAKPHMEEKRIMISLPKLPDLVKEVDQVTTAVQRLSRRIDKLEGGRS